MEWRTIYSNLTLTLGTIIGTSLGTRWKQKNAGPKTVEKSVTKCGMGMENFQDGCWC